MAHLNINPANILIINRNHVKLGGFCQARITQTGYHASVDSQGANSSTNGRRGTEGFIAPEMGVTDEIDWFKADIYSLGATIWMLVMLRWPKKTGPGDEQLEVSETHWPPLPGRGRPGLVDLVNRMLRTTPERRPSAREVVAFLDQSAEYSGSTGSGMYDGVTTSSAPGTEHALCYCCNP